MTPPVPLTFPPVDSPGSSTGGDTELVQELTATREALRERARQTLGVRGDDSEPPPLRPTLREHGLTLYPLTSLGILVVIDNFQGFAFRVLTPEISRSLGIGVGTVALLIAVQTLALSVSPLPMAAAVQRRPRRALLILVTAVLWSLATLSAGFVTATIGLFIVLLIDGLTSGSVEALHRPLLLDSHPPSVRVRVLSYYDAARYGGTVLAPLIVAVLAGPLNLTWRGVFVVMGIMCLLALPFTMRLRDPGFGRFDTNRVRQSVHELHGEGSQLAPEDVQLGFFEICRRLLLIPTVKKLLVAAAVFGVMVIPFQTFLAFYLDEDLGLGPGQRGLFFAFLSSMSIAALVLFGRRGEQLFRQDPAKVVELGGLMLAVGVILVAMAIAAPTIWMTIPLFGLAFGVFAVLGPALGIAVLSIVPAQFRPHAAALYGLFGGGVGGITGALLLGTVQEEYGVAGALVSLLVPGVLGGLLLRNCAKGIHSDLDRMIDEVIEDEEIKRITQAGGHLPLLSCSGIDFCYGQLQVLFGVDFTVDDGEMVALLGVNGAGKSTLLRVISGVGLPTSGSVRYRGQEITYLDAERRALLGITQVPGGRAVFRSLSVVDNLRSFGYTLGRDKKTLDECIDQALSTFPRLNERRNSNAATLSGGEQQMLGLSKALILRPRLLLIDELSLGLAPIIVGQLLDLVRTINTTGTAVVLVEQSVNIALGLVEHAYFMEKGEMKFDGRSADLLSRDDLLRAVFLEGASKGRGL